ncbi:MAG: hypothetical protein Q9183_006347, partial [Haloplaca sp. 2 TL-2023]
MRGHYRVIELLLQEHANVDAPGPNDETPLRIASDKGYVEVAELLLGARAKVNARDKKSMSTPLHKAAMNGNENMIDLLIRHGAHTEAKDGDLMTPLHYACEAGRDGVATQLLTKKAGIETIGRRGMTPLVCAAAAGQVHVVEALLKKKALLKHQAEGNMTALHWASYNGHYEVVNYLLDKKAPVHAANKDGKTSLHLAVIASHFAVAELLLRKGAPTEVECRSAKRPIHYACLQEDPKLLSLLLGHNVDAEAEDDSCRALHHAAKSGLALHVETLLARGVDVDARDAAGDRPLGLACRSGHLAIVRMLLNRGSPLRAKFAKGRFREDSPLCLAAKGGHLIVVHELMRRGASVLQQDEHNWSPLRHASYNAHPQVVEALLEAGATISGNPSSGWGFDITARRIGFADEVFQEHDRKSRVLQLLTDAEARERKSPEPSPASPPQSAPMNPSRAELSSSDQILAAEAQDSRHRSELPGRAYSEESSSPTSSAAEEELAALRSRRLRIPFADDDSDDTASGYPSRAH